MTLAFSLATNGAYDLQRTLFGMAFGKYDPTARLDTATLLKGAHTPSGPVTLTVRHRSQDGMLDVTLDGPGSAWVEERIHAILGLEDRPDDFVVEHEGLRSAQVRARGVRLGQVIDLGELHVVSVLQQRVRWQDASAAWNRLIRARGSAAPGTDRVLLPLTAEQWRRVPSFELRAAGVELKRYQALQVAVRAAHHLTTARGDRAKVRTLMMSLRGTGVWTTEMVLGYGLGDPDALPLGDVHLPHEVSKFFDGHPYGDDDRMVQLLAPYAGHRFRVVRLIAR